MKLLFRLILSIAVLVCLGFGAVLAFGTAKPPPELASISSPFKGVDFSDLPPARRLPAGIAYRQWGSIQSAETVIPIHGSSASSVSLHVLGKALAAAGIAVYAPDVRGHGETGQRGDVSFYGQPDEDLTLLIQHVRRTNPKTRLTLMGFSLGGGLALRNAGNTNGELIDRTILLAPALGPYAPTMKRGTDEKWARPHVPRLIVLGLLNRAGIHAFDGLEAITYAVPPGSERVQVASYSWRLLRSLFPVDYRASLQSARKPITVIVGEKDELFIVDQFEPTIKAVRPDASVIIVPGIDHINLTLDQRALAQIVAALR